MQLAPYIFFYGRCAEALEFYKGVFGGTAEVMRVKDSPMAADMPGHAGDSVMHASFKAPGVEFFASDGREQKAVNPDEGNISLALDAASAEEGEKIFNALAEGGKVSMPIAEAFWGGRFGMIQDKFGLEWMMTLP